jgi:hypothetical protein
MNESFSNENSTETTISIPASRAFQHSLIFGRWDKMISIAKRFELGQIDMSKTYCDEKFDCGSLLWGKKLLLPFYDVHLSMEKLSYISYSILPYTNVHQHPELPKEVTFLWPTKDKAMPFLYSLCNILHLRWAFISNIFRNKPLPTIQLCDMELIHKTIFFLIKDEEELNAYLQVKEWTDKGQAIIYNLHDILNYMSKPRMSSLLSLLNMVHRSANYNSYNFFHSQIQNNSWSCPSYVFDYCVSRTMLHSLIDSIQKSKSISIFSESAVITKMLQLGVPVDGWVVINHKNFYWSTLGYLFQIGLNCDESKSKRKIKANIMKYSFDYRWTTEITLRVLLYKLPKELLDIIVVYIGKYTDYDQPVTTGSFNDDSGGASERSEDDVDPMEFMMRSMSESAVNLK